MWGTVRFVDHPLLPADSPEDYPKIIKAGIDEERQHHNSPPIAGPDGFMTLFYRMGRPDFIERLLDVEGTASFSFRMDLSDTGYLRDSYIDRMGKDVEMGYYGGDDRNKRAMAGVRYRIHDPDPNLPFTFGKWEPLSTSDMGSPWSTSNQWVRAQSSAVCKGIWYNTHWDKPKIAHIRWSGMSAETRQELDAWMKQRQHDLELQKAKRKAEYDARNARLGDDEMKILEEEDSSYYKHRLRCHADCGVEFGKFQCGKCKVVRYCSADCQKEDWKWHKSYCGKEDPIPKKYIDRFTEEARNKAS